MRGEAGRGLGGGTAWGGSLQGVGVEARRRVRLGVGVPIELPHQRPLLLVGVHLQGQGGYGHSTGGY